MIQQMLAIWFLVPLPFLKLAWTSGSKFAVHVLLKPGLENFEHYFTSVWDECNCAVVWAFFGIAFLWYWDENWAFPVPWPLLSFPNLLAYWVKHLHSSDFRGPKNKICHCCDNFSIYLLWSDGTGCHDLSFLNVELLANFFTLLIHFHQEAP